MRAPISSVSRSLPLSPRSLRCGNPWPSAWRRSQACESEARLPARMERIRLCGSCSHASVGAVQGGCLESKGQLSTNPRLRAGCGTALRKASPWALVIPTRCERCSETSPCTQVWLLWPEARRTVAGRFRAIRPVHERVRPSVAGRPLPWPASRDAWRRPRIPWRRWHGRERPLSRAETSLRPCEGIGSVDRLPIRTARRRRLPGMVGDSVPFRPRCSRDARVPVASSPCNDGQGTSRGTPAGTVRLPCACRTGQRTVPCCASADASGRCGGSGSEGGP